VTASQQDAERGAELAALRAAVRDLAAGSGGIAAARRLLDAEPGGAGYDETAWRLLGADMGLAGLGIPEDRGGAGGGLAELVVVAEELGRSLLPVPFLPSTVLAGQVLARCPPDGTGVLARLCAGRELAAFVGTDADGCWRPERVPVKAETVAAETGAAELVAAGEATWQLRGQADFVLYGGCAAHLVVAASTPSGCDLFLVAGDSEGVTRRPLTTLDPTRAQAGVSFDGAAAIPLTSGGTGAGVVAEALDVALVVLAAEQVGGAAACLDMAVGYAKIRHQFGRPIGSFQAVKHKLADLLVLVEMGRSAVDRAVLACQEPGQEPRQEPWQEPGRLAEAAAVAKIWCAEAFTTVATENVQVHGGIGFTWEHDAHLYFRRARADEQLLGDARVHRERLAVLLDW